LEEVNYIESSKNQIRGNHYHKKTVEGFHVIGGKILVTLKDLSDGREKKFTVTAGDTFVIKPNTLHTFESLEEARWINMLSKAMNDNNKDIFKD
jgi:dTDP-4-dehydrorhamnose 3,5-epimerase-like enzyme